MVTDPTSYDEVSAWVSVVLAEWESTEDRLRGIQGRVDGPGLDVVSTALLRLEMVAQPYGGMVEDHMSFTVGDTGR